MPFVLHPEEKLGRYTLSALKDINGEFPAVGIQTTSLIFDLSTITKFLGVAEQHAIAVGHWFAKQPVTDGTVRFRPR